MSTRAILLAVACMVWPAATWAGDPVETLPPVALDPPLLPDLQSPAPPATPTVKLRGRIEADALGTIQEIENRRAIGVSQAATGFRRARLGAQGTFGDHLRWVSEFDFADGDVRFTDVFVGFGGLPIPGEIRVGHVREPFGLEGQISSHDVPFLERSPANSLDPARNWGVALFAYSPDESATFALGVFRAGSDRVGRSSTDESAVAATGRATWLPFHDKEAETLIHLGAAASLRSAPDGVVAIQPRPQSSLLQAGDSPLPPFIQGTTVPAESVWLGNVELAAAAGPAWVMAEYRVSLIDQPEASGVVFSGGYLSAGYFLTGEHRDYDRTRGTFGSVRVTDPVYQADDSQSRGIGAWEVAARLAYLDLTDPALPRSPAGLPAGGEAWTATAGVNWHLTDFLRIMLDYTHFRVRAPIGPWTSGEVFGARLEVFW